MHKSPHVQYINLDIYLEFDYFFTRASKTIWYGNFSIFIIYLMIIYFFTAENKAGYFGKLFSVKSCLYFNSIYSYPAK